MATNDFISEIAANLTDWNIDYTETSDGFGIGLLSVRVAEESGRALATILDGANLVGMTSDADKAAALLAFPLARRAWGLGYTGDFDVICVDGEVEMTLSYGSASLTISAGIDEAGRFTVMDHDLLRQAVVMTDLEAVLASTELAYSDPYEAWQVLCGASDFESDNWEYIVDFLNEDARIVHGARFAKVESYDTERIALVEGWREESPMCVIDVESAEDTTHWSAGDVAAAVLHAIS
jgi:hypothetical protein|nr:MAG TPA: hypothetical protein [Caudoviricetes sp.]